MKVLIVNTYDIYGGASRAAHRLYQALQSAGIKTQMIVQKKVSDDENVIVCGDDWNQRASFYDDMPLLSYPKKTFTYFTSANVYNKSLVHFINNSDADIVHLHWIGYGYMSIDDILRINKKIVWSLHDMWLFTGGCHYDEECKAYLQTCGNCKVLGSEVENDLSRKNFLQKQNIFKKSQNITIIGLSEWLHQCAKNSPLLKIHKHINLPNLINTELFSQYDSKEARKFWNLPVDKKLILFGAIATNEPRKGFRELTQALHGLTCKDVELVIFGSNEPKNAPNFGFKTHYIGHLSDDISLVKLYSTADVMVVPSLQENLSNTIMESLSCSTPVVAFDIGGNSDMIEHKTNGYLAKPFDTDDLAKGIEWVLHVSDYEKLCKNAREKVVRTFDSKVVAAKYIKFYKDILEENNRDTILLHRPNNSLQLITKEIEDWFLELASGDDKYVVYGNGTYGRAALDYLGDKIVAFVDKTSKLISIETIQSEVYSINNLPYMTYDKIIISVLGREDEIIRHLVKELHVSEDKIVRFSC